jgi:putative DNA methylase
VLGSAEASARNGAAGALEEDARLTALFLWTPQSTDANGDNAERSAGFQPAGDEAENEESRQEAETADAEEEGAGQRPALRRKGLSLIFDVVRRFAQPLNIHLPDWEDRIIQTEKGVVRLLPVADRAKQLFGEDGAKDRDLLRRVTENPSIFGGKPIVRGKRISVELILSLLAQGETAGYQTMLKMIVMEHLDEY